MNPLLTDHLQSQFDIAIAYRMYPDVSRGSALPGIEKLELARRCLISFRRALQDVKSKAWYILDRCPDTYESMVHDVMNGLEYKVIRTPGTGNSGTFAMQLDILQNQADAELVFFAEDDYLYRPNQVRTLVDFMSFFPDVDFVTPYDHPDAYNLPISISKASMRVFGGLHWRTVSSTCLTFAARRHSLMATNRVFSSYVHRNYDASIWHCLTKIGIREWGSHPLRVSRDIAGRKTIAKTFLFGWRQVFFGRTYSLWSPIPSMATHLQEGGLAPNVDWLGRDPG